jgi:hypothetical protein
MALGGGSTAIDAWPANVNCPPADQRGVSRPQGSACDIGAFELKTTPPAAQSTFNLKAAIKKCKKKFPKGPKRKKCIKKARAKARQGG